MLKLNSRHKTLLLNNIIGRGRFLSDESSDKSKTDLYGTLGLNSTATANDIKQAYYDLSFKHHPDRNKDNVEAATKFREVTEAYEVLGNYGLRKRYDKGLPMPLSRTAPAPIRPLEEFNVPLQKFFDSRQQSNRFQSRDKFEEDVFEVKDEGRPEDVRIKRYAEAFEHSKNVRPLLAVFLVVVMAVFQYYKS